MHTNLNIIVASINMMLLSTKKFKTTHDLKQVINNIANKNGCTQNDANIIMDAYGIKGAKQGAKIDLQRAFNMIWATYENELITNFDYVYIMVKCADINNNLCDCINKELCKRGIDWHHTIIDAMQIKPHNVMI